MKKLFVLIFVLCLFILPCAAKVEFPKPIGFINDYAGILKISEKEQLDSITKGLKQKMGAELAVVIVNTVDPLDSKTYATELFNAWKIGQKGKDNGVLLLLAMQERRVEIETGYGVEGVLPDAMCGRILDNYAIPYFKKDEYGQGLIKASEAIAKVVGGGTIEASAASGPSNDDSTIALYAAVIGIIIIGMIRGNGISIVVGIFCSVIGTALFGVIGAFAGFILAMVTLIFTRNLKFKSSGGATWWGSGWGSGSSGGSGGSSFGGFSGGSSGGGGAGRSF